MQNCHAGLRKIAEKLEINVDDLDIGEFVIFMNTKKTILKIFSAGNTIAHFKHPAGQPIDMRILALIPKFFNGKELHYTKAVEEVLKKELKTYQ